MLLLHEKGLSVSSFFFTVWKVDNFSFFFSFPLFSNLGHLSKHFDYIKKENG